MDYHSVIKNLLFRFEPEIAHSMALRLLKIVKWLGQLPAYEVSQPVTTMGLQFKNPVGLAAGFDKNAEYIDVLAALGFGFLEVGTVTPNPQPGNPKPRVFRLQKQQAIINRLGFNNKGVEHLVLQLKKTKFSGVLGINIGKNLLTPLDRATDDYLYCFQHVAPFASYITINISSPNTVGLRNLQQAEFLQPLLSTLKRAQKDFYQSTQKYVPLLVKIAPDLTLDELTELAMLLLAEKIDGVIATNTTLAREAILDSQYAQEKGGLSGKPLTQKTTEIVRILNTVLQDAIPIIACGGIFSQQDMAEKQQAGAKLIQVYTGLIYKGVELVKHLLS